MADQQQQRCIESNASAISTRLTTRAKTLHTCLQYKDWHVSMPGKHHMSKQCSCNRSACWVEVDLLGSCLLCRVIPLRYIQWACTCPVMTLLCSWISNASPAQVRPSHTCWLDQPSESRLAFSKQACKLYMQIEMCPNHAQWLAGISCARSVACC